MLHALAFSIVLLLHQSSAAFLVGEGEVGEKIPILCESEEYVFVSFPSGEARKLPLDSDFQSSFTPDVPGIYTIQCGKEAKPVHIKGKTSIGNTEALQEENSALAHAALALAGSAIALLFALAIYALLAAQERFSFSKDIRGKKVLLRLEARRQLRNLSIEDPVQIGFSGAPLRWKLPLLPAGTKWEYEYEIGNPQLALPATMRADDGDKGVFARSSVRIEGRGAKPSLASHREGALEKPKRKLKRAG